MEEASPPIPARLTWESIILELRNPFRLAYGVSDSRQAFWLRLSGDAGWGEGTIPPYYHIDQADIIAFWAAAAQRRDAWPDDPAAIAAWVGEAGPAPARSALDLALHDRLGRQQGKSLYQLLALPQPALMPTSFTIAIDTPVEMARQAAQIPNYPIIKIKLGSDDDEARVAAIRAARPEARLRLDANAAWTAETAVKQVQALEVYGLELVEQPVAKDDIEGMGYVQAHTAVPVVADESVQTLADVERLAAAGVRGINLKLMKVGGLAPGLRILRRARELGLQVMLGCMVETSLGTTAMAHLAGLADWLDLDAPLLVGNDPFDGLKYDEYARVYLPPRPGIGVERRVAEEDHAGRGSSRAG
jgi:L-alanine-DL-glutamate epimerase-like enolase superfamily enzyme